MKASLHRALIYVQYMYTVHFIMSKARNPYVRTRIRRADTCTSAFAASEFYMFVYPYMRMRSGIPV